MNAKKFSDFCELHAYFPQKCSRNFFCGLFQSANWLGKNIVKLLGNVADLLCKYAKENNSQLGQGLYG